MNPCRPNLEAVFASLRGARRDVFYVVEMRANWHIANSYLDTVLQRVIENLDARDWILGGPPRYRGVCGARRGGRRPNHRVRHPYRWACRPRDTRISRTGERSGPIVRLPFSDLQSCRQSGA